MAVVYIGEAEDLITDPASRVASPHNGQCHVTSVSLLDDIELDLTADELVRKAAYEASFDWARVDSFLNAKDALLGQPELDVFLDADPIPKLVPFRDGGAPLLAAARSLGVARIVTCLFWADAASRRGAWWEPSLIDVLAVQTGAQYVRDSAVPTVGEDGLLRGLASLLLARDLERQLEATQPWDFTPETGLRGGHPVYRVTRPNAKYDIRRTLDLIEANKRKDCVVPDNVTSFGCGNVYFGSLRGICGATTFRAPVANETPAEVKALASRIHAAVLARNAADVAIDADLAAQCSENLAAERARELVRARSYYPMLGYT